MSAGYQRWKKSTGAIADALDTDPLPVGRTRQVGANVTRPNDTTAYAAGDAIANATSSAVVLTFTNAARALGAGGVVMGALLLDEAAQATKGQFELYLFSAAPTVPNDNAALALSAADLRNLVGVVNFGSNPYVTNAASGASGNCAYVATGVNLPFNCGTTVQDLYGVLVVRNAYTPVAQERFDLVLQILQD